MNQKYILFLILGLDVLILLLKIPELSISYNEVALLYGEVSFLQLLINSALYLFGKNDFGLRIVMIALHIGSALLLYKISKTYIKEEKNRLWLVGVFILLPGVISSAILVNSAGLVIFGLLFFIYIYQKECPTDKDKPTPIVYLLLTVLLFVDGGFHFLFLSLVLYGLYKKQKLFLFFNLGLFISSILMFGVDVNGLPKGHFLDSIGIYAAIFTPIIFIYMVYVLYRRYLTKQLDIIWFIASVAFIISMLLSLRQRIGVEQFAPYLIIALPLAAQTFNRSYRVRLRIFRTKYKLIFTIAIVFLLLNSFLVFFNKNIYLVLENPKKHFAYKMHVAKELAQELKQRGIKCVTTNKKMAERLKFYDIQSCENILLQEDKKCQKKELDVTISYKNVPVYCADVTKINNK